MPNCKFAFVALVSLALTMPCLGQNAPRGGGPPGGGELKVDQFFKEVNTSNDGKISKEEWKAAGLLDNVFTMIDTKQQNYITKDELEAMQWPPDLDSNKDGILTVEKMKAFDKKMGGGGPGGGGPPGGAPPGGGPPPQQ